MNAISEFLSSNLLQCWACPVFDSMFISVSSAAANSYSKISEFAIIILVMFIVFYVLYIVVKQMMSSKLGDDWLYAKTLRPVFINALIILSLIGAGLVIPRTISQVALEPVAIMTTELSGTIIKTEPMSYTPLTMDDSNHFYSSGLKDMILDAIRITTSGFQNFVLFGISVIAKSLNPEVFFSFITFDIFKILEALALMVAGVYITFSFLKLFFKFMFYFLDTIIMLTMFSFMFPVSLASFVMNAAEVPDWLKSISKMSAKLFQNCVSSIITLGSVMISYVIIMAIMTGFVYSGGGSMSDIMVGNFSTLDFNTADVLKSSVGIAVLLLVIDFITKKIKPMSDEIKSAFGIKDSKNLGEEAFKTAEALVQGTKDKIVQAANFITGSEPEKPGAKKEGK